MPLYSRLPKFGFNNPFKKHFSVVNIVNLENHFNSGDTVDAASLEKAGLIKSASSLIKILGEGSLTKKLIVKAHKFSKSATQKINQAGGQVEEIKLPGESAEESNVGGG
jgi:large subunit ribosomal protein L15